jgi:hypothetical protein
VIATLTEAFSVAGFVALYLAAPRSPHLAFAVSGSLLLFVVTFNRTEFVTLQSEGLVAAVLAPLLIDVICPRVLSPQRDEHQWLKAVWCIAMIAILAILAWLHAQEPSAIVGEAVQYGRRATEAFIAMLVLAVYFSALSRESEIDRSADRSGRSNLDVSTSSRR